MLKLYPWQMEHANYLLRSLRSTRSALDLSDMGIGKTIIASWIAKQLNLPTIVMCPKSVISSWQKALKAFGVTTPNVINYEMLRTGKLQILNRNGKKFQWEMEKQALIIADEIHVCKSYGSLNGAMLTAAKPYYVLMLSATAIESPLDMQNIGYILDLYTNNFYMWALKNGVRKGFFGGLEFYGKPKQKYARLQKIHDDIKPRMSRIRIADLGDSFPSNQVYAECYDLSGATGIQKIYDQIRREMPEVYARLENSEEIPSVVALGAERQKIELLKLEFFEDRTKELLGTGKSVVVFVNFRKTLEILQEKFEKLNPAIIIGEQKDRYEQIEKFQSGETTVCISTLAAGGTGINLNDTTGKNPRVTLISPSFNARETHQALGRTARATSKSPTIQYIVYCAQTVEEKICAVMKQKLKQIGVINNGKVENQIAVQ